MTDRDGKPPAGRSDSENARRARQAEALRRNLARRKAQARGRVVETTSESDRDGDKESSDG